MKPSRETSRAALLLTNRLVKLDVKPMTAREFWGVVDRVEDLSILLHLDVGDLVEKLSFDADDAGSHPSVARCLDRPRLRT